MVVNKMRLFALSLGSHLVTLEEQFLEGKKETWDAEKQKRG